MDVLTFLFSGTLDSTFSELFLNKLGGKGQGVIGGLRSHEGQANPMITHSSASTSPHPKCPTVKQPHCLVSPGRTPPKSIHPLPFSLPLSGGAVSIATLTAQPVPAELLQPFLFSFFFLLHPYLRVRHGLLIFFFLVLKKEAPRFVLAFLFRFFSVFLPFLGLNCRQACGKRGKKGKDVLKG